MHDPLSILLGDTIDLQAIADQVHAEYFSHLPGPVPCSWLPSMPRKGGGRLLLGLCRWHLGASSILISRRLRYHWIPLQVLRSTIYHEYCHHAQFSDPTRKGEPAHGKRFRAEEARFPHFDITRTWEAAHCLELLDPVDRRLSIEIGPRLANAPVVDDTWLESNKPPDPKDPKKPTQAPAQPPMPPAPPADGGGGGNNNQPPNDPPELRNEIADADRFVRDVLGKAWYCPQLAITGKGDPEAGWLVWDGQRLSASEDGAILRLARETALRLSAEYIDQARSVGAEIRDAENEEPPNIGTLKALRARQARLITRADQVQSEKRLHGMVSLAAIDQRILIRQAELDADPDLMNFQNGIVHLPTGDLRPHDPKYRCSRITAVPYLEKSDQSVVMRLLNRACMMQQPDGTWVPDPERIRYLQDAIGQSLYGHQRMQKFYLCMGKGGDGKGTLFEALLDALGGGQHGYAMKADMQSFVRQKLSGHRIRDDLANMAGARLVLSAEINKGDALDGALIKTLSGEDTQRVRQLYGKEFEFRPICTIWMQANIEPYVDSQDDAIWRRLVKIPFGPKLQEHERDPAMRQALHDPATGGAALLAWAVEGAKRTANAKRIDPTPSVTRATDGYRDEMNPLAGYIVDDLRFADAGHGLKTFIEQRGMRPCFDLWKADSGLDDKTSPGVSGHRIGDQLRRCGAWSGVKKLKGTTRKVWLGVTLRPDHPMFAEYCHDSFVPEDTMHLTALTASGAVEVTRLPQEPSFPHTPESGMPRTHTRESLDSSPRGVQGKRGNQVTQPPGTPPANVFPPDLDDLDNSQAPF